jgi:hypothetical protein
MSIILYQNNNLVVTGDVWENLPSVGDENFINIVLNFILQVNGKMVVHYQPLKLKVRKVDGENEYCLEDWDIWYTTCSVMSSLGYSFTDERVDMRIHNNGIINGWIIKLFD